MSISETIDTDKDGNELTFGDLMADDDSLFENMERRLRASQLYRAVESELDEREKEIVVLRYGLYGKKPLTQREAADRLKISRSYVSRIEKRALEKLRVKMGD